MSEPRSQEREAELKDFIKRTAGIAYAKRAIKWFQEHLNQIIVSKELARLPGTDNMPIQHSMRRVFELRDEQGYEIINWKDKNPVGAPLKVDEWILLKTEPNPKKIRSRGVNKRIMYDVFNRDNNRCRFCGRTPDDDDPFKPGHKIRLHVGHIIAHKRENGKELVKVEKLEDVTSDTKLTSDDFTTMCNVCNEGAKNKDLEMLSPLQRVLKFDEDTQKEIYEALKEKFS